MKSFREELESKLNIIEELPTLPAIVLELERLLHKNDVSAAELTIVIEEDPAMSASILRVANSVMFYSSLSGTILSLRDAIVRMGFDEVRRIVTAAAYIRALGKLTHHLDAKRYWRRSLTTAVAGRVILNKARTSVALFEGEIYVAGLLHDIGLLVLNEYFPETYNQLESLIESGFVSRIDAERSVLGMDHGQVGGCLLEKWNLPDVLVQAVTWHNQSEGAKPDAQAIAEGVYLSEVVADVLDSEESADAIIETVLAPRLWTTFGIPADGIMAILDTTRNESTPVFALV
jgi:HD-like signal output (HDOD) protein